MLQKNEQKDKQEITLNTELQAMLDSMNNRTPEEKLEVLKRMGFTRDTQPKPWHGVKMTTLLP